jgi:hypothetical protein
MFFKTNAANIHKIMEIEAKLKGIASKEKASNIVLL